MAGFADQAVHVPHRSHVLIIGKTVDEHSKGRNLAKPCMKPFDEMMDRDEDPNAAWQVSDDPKTVPNFARGPSNFLEPDLVAVGVSRRLYSRVAVARILAAARW
ncbi:hypothetical protein N0V85_001839 [Neurospora sp. IMI 360204]|nr:hypothetical protein N0V85_001839 [Neurospora sp. IMI 360204]